MSLVTEKMILSPYTKGHGKWFKGSLHNHTVTSKRGNTSPAKAREIYESERYDFIALTDHDRRFPSLPWREVDWNIDTPGKFVILRGYEASHPLGHINCIGCLPQDVPVAPSDKGFVDAVNATGALTFLNHPNAFNKNPEKLYANVDLKNIMGIEIYSGSRARKKEEGNEDGHLGLYTRLWDEALSRGMKLWGFANPDCHSYDPNSHDSPFNGYNIVFAESLTEKALMDSLKQGCFYASTGIELETISVEGNLISVVSKNATKVKFIGKGGIELKSCQGRRGRYEVNSSDIYVRVELQNDMLCYPKEKTFFQTAWAQPIFIK